MAAHITRGLTARQPNSNQSVAASLCNVQPEAADLIRVHLPSCVLPAHLAVAPSPGVQLSQDLRECVVCYVEAWATDPTTPFHTPVPGNAPFLLRTTMPRSCAIYPFIRFCHVHQTLVSHGLITLGHDVSRTQVVSVDYVGKDVSSIC
jgi:hypothetical protein